MPETLMEYMARRQIEIGGMSPPAVFERQIREAEAALDRAIRELEDAKYEQRTLKRRIYHPDGSPAGEIDSPYTCDSMGRDLDYWKAQVDELRREVAALPPTGLTDRDLIDRRALRVRLAVAESVLEALAWSRTGGLAAWVEAHKEAVRAGKERIEHLRGQLRESQAGRRETRPASFDGAVTGMYTGAGQ